MPQTKKGKNWVTLPIKKYPKNEDIIKKTFFSLVTRGYAGSFGIIHLKIGLIQPLQKMILQCVLNLDWLIPQGIGRVEHPDHI